MSNIVWVRGVPGIPGKLYWPGEIRSDSYRVFIKSDNAILPFKEKVPFEIATLAKYKDLGTRLLKRKKETLKAFLRDVDWALQEHVYHRETSRENLQKHSGDEKDINGEQETQERENDSAMEPAEEVKHSDDGKEIIGERETQEEENDSAMEPAEEVKHSGDGKEIIGERETQEDNDSAMEPAEEVEHSGDGKEIIGERETQEDNDSAMEPAEEVKHSGDGKEINGKRETQEDKDSAMEPAEEVEHFDDGKEIIGEQETQEDKDSAMEPAEEVKHSDNGKEIIGERETQEKDNDSAMEPAEEVKHSDDGKDINGEQETQEDNDSAMEPAEEVKHSGDGKEINGKRETQEDKDSAMEPAEEVEHFGDGKEIIGEQETQEDKDSAMEPAEEVKHSDNGKDIIGERETQEKDNDSAMEPAEEVKHSDDGKDINGEQETQEDNDSAMEPAEEVKHSDDGKEIIGERETQEKDNDSAMEPAEEVKHSDDGKDINRERETQEEENDSAMEPAEEVKHSCDGKEITGERETQEEENDSAMEPVQEVINCFEPQVQEMREKEMPNIDVFINMLMSNSIEQDLEEEILSPESDSMSPLIAYPVFHLPSPGCEHIDVDVLSSDDEWIPPVKQRKKQIFSSSDSSDNSLDCSPNEGKNRDDLDTQKAIQKGSVVQDQVSEIGRSGTAENLIGQVDNEQRIGECSENDADEPEKEVTLEENEIIRAKDNRNVYIRKVLKNSNITASSQPSKKLDRVYNRRHCCFICKKMVLHIPSHFKNRHSSVPEVNEAINKTGKRKFDALRAKGDDLHNKKVIQEGKGELIISRRPNEFQTSDFGPCPYCLDWINLKYLTKHNKKVHSSGMLSDETIAKSSSPDPLTTQSKRILQLEADKLEEVEEKVEKESTKNKKTDRKRWTEDEIKELNMYFKEFLKTKTCPRKKDCLKTIEKSKARGGPLAARYWHTIVKKISNLNKKL